MTSISKTITKNFVAISLDEKVWDLNFKGIQDSNGNDLSILLYIYINYLIDIRKTIPKLTIYFILDYIDCAFFFIEDSTHFQTIYYHFNKEEVEKISQILDKGRPQFKNPLDIPEFVKQLEIDKQ